MRKRLLIYLLKWYREQLINHYSELKVEAMKRASAFGAGTNEYYKAWNETIEEEIEYGLQLDRTKDFIDFVKSYCLTDSETPSLSGVLFLFGLIAGVVILLYLQYC